MKIKDIMKTNVDLSKGRSAGKKILNEDTSIFELFDNLSFDRYTEFDVLNDKQEKTGEIRGAKLEFLRQQFERLKLSDMVEILGNIEDGVVIVNSEGYICYENPAYEQIVGVPMRKTLGRNMHDIEPEAKLLNVLETGREVRSDDQLIRSVGKHVTIHVAPIIRNGRVAGAYSVFRDVTKEHQLTTEVERVSGLAEEYKNILDEQNSTQELDIISTDAAYQAVLKKAIVVARTDASVLIRGANGTGKEVLANFIHKNSSRKEQPMITINCAAIPEELIESELFGYEEGTFTGAKKGGKIGRFELANGGTIFLDEIGDMPYAMQAKLLRVLQEREIEKIGRSKSIPIDVRVIAATNQPLEEMIETKQFRQDLFYRLNVVSFTIPPLCERKSDILSLTNKFLEEFNEKYGRKLTIATDVYQLFYDFPWPGNVRELRNTLESAVIMCQNGQINLRDLPQRMIAMSGVQIPAVQSIMPVGQVQEMRAGTSDIREQVNVSDDFRGLKEEVERFERALILAVIDECGGDKDKALEKLGISKRSLYRKLSEEEPSV